jgi:hypothetical protein
MVDQQRYGVWNAMNSIAVAFKQAAKSVEPKMVVTTVRDGRGYRHAVRYNENDPTERCAVRTRVRECLQQGYYVITKSL